MDADRLDPGEILETVAQRLSEALLDPKTPPGTLAQLASVALKSIQAAAERRPVAIEPADDPSRGHPDLPPLLPVLPGPPWDPWRGLSDHAKEALEVEFRARRAVWLRQEAAALVRYPGVRSAVLRVRDDLTAVRKGASQADISACVRARLGIEGIDDPTAVD